MLLVSAGNGCYHLTMKPAKRITGQTVRIMLMQQMLVDCNVHILSHCKIFAFSNKLIKWSFEIIHDACSSSLVSSDLLTVKVNEQFV